MTLKEADAIANAAVAEQVLADGLTTSTINAAIDRGLARLRQSLGNNYEVLRDLGSLSVNNEVVTSIIGPGLLLLPAESRSTYEQLFSDAITTASERGFVMGNAIASNLDPTFTESEIAADVSRAEDAARRLYRHIEDFRSIAIATITLAIQQQWTVNRVQEQLALGTGRLKGRVSDNIAKTEGQTALVAASAAVYALMEGAGQYDIWNVSYSEPTCSRCIARDGNVYKRGDAHIPLHGRGRCYWAPYNAKWDDKAYRAQRHREGLQVLRDAGLSPDYSASPFERAIGLSAPVAYLKAIG